jgi:hypothetical protein
LVRALYKVLVADAVLLAAVYLVLQDIAMRVSCTIPGCNPFVPRTSAVYSYSIFTKTLALGVNGNTLTSPLTLDWIQVLGLALLLVNLWYVYGLLRSRGVVSAQRPVVAATA